MIAFLVKEKIRIDLGGRKERTLLPPGQSVIPNSNIPGTTYITTTSGFARMDQAFASKGVKPTPLFPVLETLVKSAPGFPVELGTQKYGELERNLHVSGIQTASDLSVFHPPSVDLAQQLRTLPERPLRIAILNGLGSQIGDTIVGLTALRSAVNLIKSHAKISALDIVVDADRHDRLAPVLRQSGMIGNIHTFPLRLPELMKYDAYFDMSGITHFEDFDRLPMLDFFLKAMGVAPASLTAEKRRNMINIDARTARRLAPEIDKIHDAGSPLLLFHPTASTPIRSVPPAEHERLIASLRECHNGQIVSVDKITGRLPSVVDLSRLSTDFAAYCYIISRMDQILTVDTSIYHIADSFNIPTVVWFTTINPEKRLGYYPAAAGIMLENDPASGILGKHISYKLEDLTHIQKLWSEVDPQDAVRLLGDISGHT